MSIFSGKQLAEWSGGAWVPVCPDCLAGVSNDTRTITNGNLYFALKGKNFDDREVVRKYMEERERR